MSGAPLRRSAMEFHNTYEDPRRAAAYSELEFGGTYHLAFRDLPRLLRDHIFGQPAVDFGCGTGRSSRFLQQHGFATVGLDISAEMVAIARTRDPAGDYRVIDDGDFAALPAGGYDLVLAAFTFDNIPTYERRVRLFDGLRRLLAVGGRIVNIVSTPEMYTHEWATFTTKDYPENQVALRRPAGRGYPVAARGLRGGLRRGGAGVAGGGAAAGHRRGGNQLGKRDVGGTVGDLRPPRGGSCF
jgi:SAM-dependent methyltransferase